MTLNFGTCKHCGEPANHFSNRCEEHYYCDGCGTRENLCSYGKDGLLCDSCHQILMDRRIFEFKGDTSFESLITCPFCGYVINDSWEHNQDNGDTLTCPDCENDFELEVIVDVKYTTRKPLPENEVKQ